LIQVTELRRRATNVIGLRPNYGFASDTPRLTAGGLDLICEGAPVPLAHIITPHLGKRLGVYEVTPQGNPELGGRGCATHFIRLSWCSVR
jgi:hypothetical protein